MVSISDDKKFLEKYENLLDKGYCDCNEMNCIDDNSPRRILNICKSLQQENQQLKSKKPYKDFKERNDKLKEQYELCRIREVNFERENQQLKEQVECLLNQKKNFEYVQANALDNIRQMQEQLKQRDEVIDEAIKKLGRYADEMTNNGNAYAICVDLLDTLKKYKGDNK